MKKQIRLDEGKFRELVSYSVAQLLREAYGKPFSDGRGGEEYEDSSFGDDSTEISFSPWEDDDQYAAFQQATEELGCPIDVFDDGGRFYDIWPVSVRVNFTRTQGMRGGYDTPDDPDETKVTGWDIVDGNIPSPATEVIDKALGIYFSDYFDPDEGFAGLNEGWDKSFNDRVHKYQEEHPTDHSKNKGKNAHFPGLNHGGRNPYADMTWDEYRKAKKSENMKDKNREDKESGNRGTTAHFNEGRIRISEAELKGIIAKAISEARDGGKKKIDEGLGGLQSAGAPGEPDGDEPTSQYSDKASGTFTMKYRSGDVKCKMFVSKSHDLEVCIDVFQYDPACPETNKWQPQFEWSFYVEEYVNGGWLPYWETLAGDSSANVLAKVWPKAIKLLVKIGYLADEDDEVPFR